MAGLNFIWSKGAAGPGETTKEIDFVPHILSCRFWLAFGWHSAVPCLGEPGCNIVLCISLSLSAEGGLTVLLFGGMKHGSRASENSG